MIVGKVLKLAMLLAVASVPTAAVARTGAAAPTEVRLDWNVVASTSRKTPTLQINIRRNCRWALTARNHGPFRDRN